MTTCRPVRKISTHVGCVHFSVNIWRGGEAFFVLSRLGFVASFRIKLSDAVSSEIKFHGYSMCLRWMTWKKIYEMVKHTYNIKTLREWYGMKGTLLSLSLDLLEGLGSWTLETIKAFIAIVDSCIKNRR